MRGFGPTGVAAVAVVTALAVSGAVPADDARSAVSPTVMAVELEGERVGTRVVLEDTDGVIYIEAADASLWRFGRPEPDLLFEGVGYVCLAGLDGVAYEIERERQVLSIRRTPSALATTTLDGRLFRFGRPQRPPPGLMLTYDALFQRTGALEETSVSAEAVVFGRVGHGELSMLGRDLTGDGEPVRLETRWTLDLPKRVSSLRVGDTISRATRWSRSVRMAGAQWTTAFDTRPDLVTYPLPSLTGVAAVPSTVDLYVDGALRLSRPVPVGPFEVRDPPLLNGSGEAQLVVRDLLGREQLISVPYDTHGDLLRRGLNDVSYEVGFLRRGFGLESFDYGTFVASGTFRRGITDRLTLETQAQVLEEDRVLGFGALVSVPRLGVVGLAAAASDSDRAGSGQRVDLSVRRVAGRFSFSIRSSLQSRAFVDAATVGGARPITEQSQLRLGFSRRRSVLAVSYLRDDGPGREVRELVSLSATATVRRRLAFTFAFVDELGRGEPTVRFGLTRRLGVRTARAEAVSQAGEVRGAVELSRTVPQGLGFGYRFGAELGERGERANAAAVWRTERGTLGAEVASAGGELGYRLSAGGSVVGLGKRLYLTRRVVDSFAVVDVGGLPDVRVYVNNQLTARTGRRGRALVPALRAFHDHDVRIEPSDLPIDIVAERLDRVLVPYRRSGLMFRVPIRAGRGAVLTVVRADGSALPAGARVVRVGMRDEGSHPVGIRGEVFVPILTSLDRFEARWGDQRCRFDVRLDQAVREVPRLGPFVCQPIEPSEDRP